MNKKYNDINIPKNLDNAIQKGVLKAKNNTKKKILIAAVACFICLAGFAGVMNPAIAENIPIASNIFEYLKSRADSKSMYSNGNQFKYSQDVNEAVKDNGVEITINEVYCDGINAFLSYTLKSDKEIERETYNNMMFLESEVFIDGVHEKARLQNGDTSGYLCDDNHTYVGMMRLVLEDEAIEKINSDGYLFAKIHLSKFFIDDGKKDINFFTTKHGNWNFEVKLSKDSENVEEINPNLSQNGITLDKIVITPASTVISVSSEEEFEDGILIDAIDNNHNYVDWSEGHILNDGKRLEWMAKCLNEDAKSLKICIVNKNTEEKLALFDVDISKLK